jgi:hypothetical protein
VASRGDARAGRARHDSVNRVILLHALDLALSRYWHLGQAPCAINRIEAGAGLGLAFLYLLALVEFTGRFAGAAIDPAAARAQIRHWTAHAAMAVGLIAVLALEAGSLPGLIPPMARSAVAAAGGIVAFVAAIRALRVRADRRP